MNKETFLEELREHLRILEDQEQEDILEEYAQHIDMKLQKGLSEEEAIRDFGPMKELAAEILEAYHVKPEFDKKKSSAVRMPELKGIKIVDGGKAFRRAGGFLKAECMACARGIGRAFRWFGRKCRAAAAWLTRPFSKKRALKETGDEFMYGEAGTLQDQERFLNQGYEQADAGQAESSQEKARTENGIEMRQKPKRSVLAAVFHGIKVTWDLFAAFCIWWMRLIWNLAWLFMAVFFGFFTMLMLMGLGAGAVLLPQGYPVAGILLICLGGMLCFGVLSCGSFSLLIRKNKEKPEEIREEKAAVSVSEEIEAIEEQINSKEETMTENI